jgi:hypothetical protein
MQDATSVRRADKECLKLVTSHPWKDCQTIVPIVNLQMWRKSFPNARTLNISKGPLRRTFNVRGVWPAKHFKGMESILHLNIVGTYFKSEDFRHFPNLKILECGDNPMVRSFDHLMTLEQLVMHKAGLLDSCVITHQALPLLRTLHLINCHNFVMRLTDLTVGVPWVSNLEHLKIFGGSVRFLHPGPWGGGYNTSFPPQYFKAFKALLSLSLIFSEGYASRYDRSRDHHECCLLHFKHLRDLEIVGMGDKLSVHFFSILRDRGVRWSFRDCHPITQFLAEAPVLKSSPKFVCSCEIE